MEEKNDSKNIKKPILNQQIINNNLNQLGDLFFEITSSMQNMQNICKNIQDEMNNLENIYCKIKELDEENDIINQNNHI
jgi:hypothetical protein